MATLRDYVSANHILGANQSGYYWEIDMPEGHGYTGEQGPELGEAYYNVQVETPNGNNNMANVEIELSYEKIHDFEDYTQTYYPILGFSMNPNFVDYRDLQFPVSYIIGENLWWGSADEFRIADGKLRNYKATMKLKPDGYFDNAEYNFEVYYQDESLLQYTGFDTIAHASYAPQYDQYMYRIGAYSNIFSGRLICVPSQIIGDPRTNTDWYEIFGCGNYSPFTESTPAYRKLSTNIPIVVWDSEYYTQHSGDCVSAMHSYQSDGDLTRFNQYVQAGVCVLSNQYRAPSVTENTKQYDMYCDVYSGYWDIEEVENETYIESRYLQVWVAPSATQQTEPRVSLYKAKVGNELRCNIKVYGDIKQYRYSTDRGNTWTTVEFHGIPLTLPWEYLYYKRTNELRRLVYDKNHGGNMLLYGTEALCDEGSPYMADDYADKNFFYPTTNSTGDPELSTLMGTTGMKSGFSTKYVLNYSDIVNLSNELFDSNGMIDDLKKGIEMLGSNPIDAIQGLMYFPFDLANFFNLGTSQSIIIGGYTLQTASGKFMTSYNGYFEIGSISIVPSFPGEDYRNYEPYCNLNVFLPFIGLQSLKMNKYVGKIMSIRYYLDATNGACMACLFADGLLTDYFTGQVGVNLPITLTDYASYAGAAMQSIVAMAEGGANYLVSGTQSNIAGAIEGLTEYETSLFNLSQESINNFKTTKGTSSSLMNHFLPNYVYVIFEIIETDETSNLSTLEGRRSNASGNLGSFSGYLQVEDVKIKCGIATENEKNEIKQLLHSGVYI